MSVSLYPYQQLGAEWLASRKHALLADDMGLGKSAQAIVAAGEATRLVQYPAVVVVCPASVVENWRREFDKFWMFGDGLRLKVTSYDRAMRNPDDLLFSDKHLDVLILDEAHYLKTHTAKRTQAIFGPKCDGVGGLVERADRVILLTGTPMPNHPAEMWPALRALAPETITGTSGKPYSYWQFVSKFCRTRDNGFGIQIVGAKNHDLLKEKLEPFMLRRLKSEVLKQLPEIAFDELYVEGRIDLSSIPGDEILRSTLAVKNALETEGIEGLKKIASHVATLRRLTGLAKVAGVVEWVKDFLEGSDRKIVLFAHHREVIDALQEGIVKAATGVGVVTLVGASSAEWRQDAIDLFQNGTAGCRVFIGNIQAAGVGITLTAASDVLFCESSWVPSDNAQAAARCHRIGQDRGVMVRFATLAGSIDEQIQKAVMRKSADIARIVGA